MEERSLVEQFKHLTEQVLPERAQREHWPVRFDHCFKRICLDHACGGVWTEQLARPAERNLREPFASRAVEAAAVLASEGLTTLDTMNRQSLVWRKELKSGRNSRR